MGQTRATIAVLGDGGWGTTLAIHLHRLGHHAALWSVSADYAALLKTRRNNVKFLPGVPIPRSLPITADLSEAVCGAGVVILAIPSQYLRGVVQRLKPHHGSGTVFLSVGKGLERGSLKRMSQVVHEELGQVRLAVLSGPNIALEIATGHPASSVVACRDRALAVRLQRLLMNERFRVYTSTDVAGVELGGALKNPIAIAAGISDGLGFGTNAKAALMTRGVVEMVRLGVAMGAKERTFWGLSGLGDLATTCLSGRNRWLGEQLGRGKTLAAILHSTPMVIEGVDTAKAALALSRRHRVELPIIDQVNAVLFRGQSPRHALQALMRRSGKSEYS